MNKPDEGFWTSTLKGNNSSEWKKWAKYEGFGDISSGTILEIQKGVSMYIIDTKKHFELLIKKFPYKNIYIDFVEFSKVYDALCVTKKGIKNNIDLVLWNVESTVWFNIKYLKIIKDIKI